MARLSLRICLRIAAAVGLLTLAFVLASLDPFLSAAPLASSGAGDRTPPVAVDRTLKGDRLPLFDSSVSRPAALPDELRARDRSTTRAKVPVGCDPSFSPVSSPSMAHFYGRCMT